MASTPHQEEAERDHDKRHLTPNQLTIYTDGSGINGKIGAAAVSPETHYSSKVSLGRESTATVPAAELCGIPHGPLDCHESKDANGV